MLKLLLIAGLFLFQAPQGDDPPITRPPEAGPDVPRCNNFFKTAQKCACNKAMKCKGNSDSPPEGLAKWCTHQCQKNKCDCIDPCVTGLKPCSHHGMPA